MRLVGPGLAGVDSRLSSGELPVPGGTQAKAGHTHTGFSLGSKFR